MSESPSTESHLPKHLDLKLPEQELHLVWADGRRSVFPLRQLRGRCPCAACRAERTEREQATFPILSNKPTDGLRVVNASLAGNYAIKLVWSDGHNTGLFDFRYLRSLDARLADHQPVDR